MRARRARYYLLGLIRKRGEVTRFMQLQYDQTLGSPYLMPQTIQPRPMRSPTMIKDTTVIMMFWKKVKSVDQKRVKKRIKISQPMNTSIDTAMGMIGFLSLIVKKSIMKVKYIIVWMVQQAFPSTYMAIGTRSR